MFTAAGTVMCKVDEVKFAEAKFAKDENAFDLCIHGTSINDPNQGDWWRGEVSGEYGKGNFATMTQFQITMKTLRAIGFEGDDLTKVGEQLTGKEIPFHIKATPAKDDSGKVFYNVQYIGEGGGDQPKEIDAGTMQARLTSLLSAASAAAPVAQPKAAVPTGNPFAKPAAPAATGGAAANKLPF